MVPQFYYVAIGVENVVIVFRRASKAEVVLYYCRRLFTKHNKYNERLP